eukprot:6214262-Pleurochrysis_carterae.AAC.1
MQGGQADHAELFVLWAAQPKRHGNTEPIAPKEDARASRASPGMPALANLRPLTPASFQLLARLCHTLATRITPGAAFECWTFSIKARRGWDGSIGVVCSLQL